MHRRSLPAISRTGLGLGLAASFLLAGCTAPPPAKHKSTGKFNPWGSYEGKHFEPLNGVVTAVDPAAGTIRLQAREKKTLQITPQTRVMHDGDDITLAQLPVNSHIKYTLSDDGQQVLTVWYGHTLNHDQHRTSVHQDRNTLY